MKIASEDKIINRIALMYGIIVAVVNYVGFLMASSGGMPVANTTDYQGWISFMNSHSVLVNILSVLAFATPALLIILYWATAGDEWKKRIINLPFVYSAIGSLGWVLSFLSELGCLLVAKHVLHIEISEIAIVSLINILQECICIFTLAFLILDFIHRKYVLPQIYPEGNLSRFGDMFKPSLRFVVQIFYLSICIFPAFYLTSTLITILRNNGLRINATIWVTIVCIMFFSVIILWTFCDYLSNPIKKLKMGTQKIMDGQYGYKVKIVSNDDFGELADAFNEMSFSLNEKNERIQAIQNSIIQGMAVIKAAPMHDLGKIAVDDAILRKPGKFTEDEFEKMKSHASEGARIVENVLSQVEDENFKKIAVNLAHYHHEKWDGTGYPEKIAGEDIPLEARIMALADVFDALVSKRCYKESFSYDKAFSIIEESLGKHFDPKLGKVFIECREKLESLYNGYNT